MKHVICGIDELLPGSKRLVHLNQVPVIVARISPDELTAFYGRCPHHGADLNRSELTYITESSEPGTYQICRVNEMIRCPWHGFEYDTKTGRSVVDPVRYRMKTYKTYIEDGQIVVEL